MENIQYTLRDEMPAKLRLETYKKALNYYLNPETSINDYWGDGLCLVLPCALWNLSNYKENVPQHKDKWNYRDTPVAFPEVKESIESIARKRWASNKRLNHLRAEALKEVIKQLENEIS